MPVSLKPLVIGLNPKPVISLEGLPRTLKTNAVKEGIYLVALFAPNFLVLYPIKSKLGVKKGKPKGLLGDGVIFVGNV